MLIVVPSECIDLAFSVGERREPVDIEALVSEAPVERLDRGVVRRLAAAAEVEHHAVGIRPEVHSAQPADVDLERRVWNVRDGKGGWGPGVYLNDDMMTAWRLFVKADAWGVFDINSFSRVLRSAGWPRGVRAYNLRYAVGISLSESGADLSDVQAHRGHRRISTTREHYVPVLGSRMQAISEQIDGRLQWDDEPIMAPDHGTVRK